jgi:hypothetical protein
MRWVKHVAHMVDEECIQNYVEKPDGKRPPG